MTEHRTNIYMQLDYDQYKRVEAQMRDFVSIERSHISEGKGERFYHNSIRLAVGSLTIEFQGPIVKEPLSS